MTPEQQQLHYHVQAIAQILYEDTSEQNIDTLAQIKTTVRKKT